MQVLGESQMLLRDALRSPAIEHGSCISHPALHLTLCLHTFFFFPSVSFPSVSPAAAAAAAAAACRAVSGKHQSGFSRCCVMHNVHTHVLQQGLGTQTPGSEHVTCACHSLTFASKSGIGPSGPTHKEIRGLNAPACRPHKHMAVITRKVRHM